MSTLVTLSFSLTSRPYKTPTLYHSVLLIPETSHSCTQGPGLNGTGPINEDSGTLTQGNERRHFTFGQSLTEFEDTGEDTFGEWLPGDPPTYHRGDGVPSGILEIHRPVEQGKLLTGPRWSPTPGGKSHRTSGDPESRGLCRVVSKSKCLDEEERLVTKTLILW